MWDDISCVQLKNYACQKDTALNWELNLFKNEVDNQQKAFEKPPL